MGDAIPEDSVATADGDMAPKLILTETPLRASFRSKQPSDILLTGESILERNGSIYSSSRFETKNLDGFLSQEPQDLVFDAVPPDGGWGWVIVAASFYCCAVIDGFSSVVGILLPRLMDHFEGTTTSTMALGGSLYAGTFLLSGVVASCSINKFGCKATTMTGSLITTVSFIASTFAPTAQIFILLFGVCGGFGIGFVYLPASVMVNYYFYHRRGLANGISCSGSGAGILVLSPLADLLADLYGWKGCLVVMAGLALQCAVCGALMRPLRAKVIRCSPAEAMREFRSFRSGGGTEEASSRRDSTLIRPTFKSFLDDDDDDDQTDDRSKNDSAVEIDGSTADVGQAPAHRNVLRISCHPPGKNPAGKKNPVSRSNAELSAWARVHSLSSSAAVISKHPPGLLTRRSRQTSECISLFEHRHVKTSFCSVDEDGVVTAGRPFRSGGVPAAILENVPLRSSQCRSVVAGQVEVPPLKKIDIFYSGSMATLTRAVSQCPGFQSSAVFSGLGISQYLSQEIAKPSVPETPQALEIILEKEPRPSFCPPPFLGRLLGSIGGFLDLTLLASVPFAIISISSVFIQIGFFVPILFLSDHAQKLGMSPKEGALLLSVLGGANMIGRALAGGLASVSCLNILHLNGLSLIVSGILTGFVFAFSDFRTLIFYSTLFGLFIAFFTPLTPMFLVKYLGLEKLTNSFGLLSMIKGLATMAGPPLAGALYFLNHSYNTTFLFGGGVFVCAGLVSYLLALLRPNLRSIAEECTCIRCQEEID